MRRNLRFCFFGLLLCLPVMAAYASDALTLRAGADRAEDYTALRYFCLPTIQAPDLTQVLAPTRQWPWQASGPEVPNRGINRDTCWFRLRVQNQDNAATDWFLVIKQPLVQELDLYRLGPDGKPVAGFLVGSNRPFGNRPYPSQNYAFPLQLPGGGVATDFLIRVRSTSLQLPLELVQAHRFANEALIDNLVQGLFFGGMIIMILYNLFLFLSIREAAYFYYVCWSVVVTLVQADLHGLVGHFFWPQATHATTLLLPAGIILGPLFTLSFLRLNQQPSRARLLLRLHVLAGVGAMIFALLVDQYYSVNVNVLLFLSMDICIFAIGLQRSLTGDSDARYLMVAWFCFIAGTVALALQKLDVVPRNAFTDNLAQIGSFIEVALLSLALASRISRLKTSHARAELDAIAAEARSQASGEFLATMSHEIRTPMNGVLGLTDLLRHTRLDTQQLQYVETIYASSNSLLTIINDILDYSRIEAGQLRLENIDTPIEQLLDESVALFAARAMEKNLPLLTYIGKGVPVQIRSDPSRLKQIINNLVSNAIKFTDTGAVSISLRMLSSNGDGRAVLEFAVEDSGIGIAPAEQEHLFRPFSQADSSTTRRYGGSGLGLSICKRLCDLLEGSIGLDSEPGRGSRFWFRIPVTDIEPAPAINILARRSLLIATIDPGLRSSLCLLGERWGMEVRTAESFEIARSLLREADGPRYAAIVLGPEMASVLAWFADKAGLLILLQESFQPRPIGNFFMRMDLPLRVLHLRAALSEGLQAPAVIPAHNPMPEHHIRPDLRVMVAEDNSVNQVVIRGILKSAGLRPLLVENGSAALGEVASASAPWDVIFMDCEMPEMDGYEATRRIRALEASRGSHGHCWIIALSAHATLDYIQKARMAGVDDYLSKPVSRQLVLDALRRVPS